MSAKLAVIENIATMVAVVAIVLGGFYLGAGGWSLWGLVLLLNMNTNSQITPAPPPQS